MAYLQLGKPDRGKGPLAEASRHFASVDDAEMHAECVAAEASIALLEQRPDALELAMRALAACRSLRKIPNALELRTLNGLASAQYLFGDLNEAVGTFEAAIERADPVLDMRRLGKLLDSAGIAYRELGQLQKAVHYSSRAVALFEALNDLVSLARAENNLGWALTGRGELTSARTHLERALQLHDQTNLVSTRSVLLSSLCELCVAEGHIGLAASYADAALELGERQNEAWCIAKARMWKGRIAARLLRDAATDTEFHSALAILENSGMTARLVRCHAEYAEILERRGDLPRAYEQIKAAVRVASSTRQPTALRER
jgi:tetratricopeptide (TPR) repeat protein